MGAVTSGLRIDGQDVIRLESDHLRVEVAPGVGGRLVSVVVKPGGHELLWRNKGLPLACLPAGSPYDPNFYGGIDELLPNDIPETINGVACDDHGELWTTPLEWKIEGEVLAMAGVLPKFGLRYERRMSLRQDGPTIDSDYRLTNVSTRRRDFLWKPHAAIAIQEGDVIDCPAAKGQVADLAWSRFGTTEPFDWPLIEGRRADVVPAKEGTVDFFYLYDLRQGRVAWRRPSQGLELAYEFDLKVFPYVWLFASYGGLDGHYTAVLEPCTCMPLSVSAAVAAGRCSSLEAGRSLETRVSVRAGRCR